MVVENLVFNIRRTGDAAAGGINNTAKSMHNLSRASSKATKHTGQLLSSLKRIAMYRILRTIIKEITQAFSDGLKHAYAFSQTINGNLAQAMDSITSKGMQMKNQLGSALGELLMNLRPLLELLATVITRVADAFSQLFAVLGGRSTYNKAIASTEQWQKAAIGAGKAAKEWKNQLLGFDEINKLEAPSDGGGGGGSADSIGNWQEAEANMKWAEELKRITTEWWNGLNFEPIINSWNRLKEALSGFLAIVDSGLRWAYENVLLPLAGWTIEEGLPAVISLVASAFEFLNAVLEKLSPVFSKLWNDYLKPFAAWIGDTFIDVVNWLKEGFEGLTEKVKNANSLSEFLTSLNGKEAIVLALVTVFGLLALSLSPINTAILAIVAAGTLLYKNWDVIKETAKKLADGVKSAFTSMEEKLSNFSHKIMDPITSAFDSLIEKVREAWSFVTGFFSWLGGSSANVQTPNVAVPNGYATGGFPEDGLFFANHNELVGQFSNGRTAVANNDQIIEGVSQGVAEAVSAVLGDSAGNQPVEVKVYLDSKEIRAGQQRLARAAGSA